jgi:hypothetical protein
MTTNLGNATTFIQYVSNIIPVAIKPNKVPCKNKKWIYNTTMYESKAWHSKYSFLTSGNLKCSLKRRKLDVIKQNDKDTVQWSPMYYENYVHKPIFYMHLTDTQRDLVCSAQTEVTVFTCNRHNDLRKITSTMRSWLNVNVFLTNVT